ncbi:MAG: hypothetical protein NTV28_03920, partial [Propionibacteriales bacterium]|nr:hypothetical protein [Propionibacteriales bacterium]
TRLRNAMDALDAAADTCKRAINAASGHFKDSTMDDVKGAVSAVLKVLVDALTIIAIIIAVVLIVLVIIGSGGTALAAFLTAAAFWVGLSILALTSVQYFMGDASLEDVGWAALGAIGGGLTKFVGAGAKAIVGTTRLQVLTRVADQARRSLPFYVKFAQRIPIGFVSRWAQGRELAAVTAAVTRAASVIDDAAVRSPLITRALGVVGLDDVVNNFLRIRAMSTLGLEAAETTALTTATLRNVAGLGAAGMSGVAQAHDFSEILDAVTSFPDTLHDSDIAILDAADGVPERDMPLPDPTRVTPVGR